MLAAANAAAIFVVGAGAIFGALVVYGALKAPLPLSARLAIIVAYAVVIAALAVSVGDAAETAFHKGGVFRAGGQVDVAPTNARRTVTVYGPVLFRVPTYSVAKQSPGAQTAQQLADAHDSSAERINAAPSLPTYGPFSADV